MKNTFIAVLFGILFSASVTSAGSRAFVTLSDTVGAGIHSGCVGFCPGKEQVVAGGQVTCVFQVTNISDDATLRIKGLRTETFHRDDTDVDENILATLEGKLFGFPPELVIPPHGQVQWTYYLTADKNDLFLPNRTLTGVGIFTIDVEQPGFPPQEFTAPYGFFVRVLRRLPNTCK